MPVENFEYPALTLWEGDRELTEMLLRDFRKLLAQNPTPENGKVAAMIDAGEVNEGNIKEKLQSVGAEFDSFLLGRGYDAIYSEYPYGK